MSNELLPMSAVTDENLNEQIKLRQKMFTTLVGDLYRSIVADEVIVLNKRKSDIELKQLRARMS